jgi:streptomycin 6-kinase
MFSIPNDLIQTAIETSGDQGAAWVERLPGLVVELAKRWSLAVDPPFPALSYNFAAPATRADGTAAVLKIGLPGGELKMEGSALRLYDGRGVVRVLELDLERGAMLLERAEPGTPLFALQDDDEATEIAARLMRELWRPVPADHPFPTVADWGEGFSRHRAAFDGTSGPLPAAIFDDAERTFADLLATSAGPVLLHGDLHHGNILAAQREPWLAIDPKGLVGEPAYETGAWLRNWLGTVLDRSNPAAVLSRRVDLFSEVLGFDRERIRAWGFAQAVLSAVWTIEDHGYGWENAARYAELLR